MARGINAFSGLQPIKAKLLSSIQFVSSAAASALSINAAVVCNTSTFPELSTFAALYDEVSVKNIKLHYQPFVSTVSAGVGYTTGALALEFDPSVGGPAAVQAVLESSHSVGPLFLSQGTANGGANYPSCLHYRTLAAKMPGPLAPIVSSDSPGSAWFTLDVTPPTLAVINGYWDALGASGIVTMFYFVELQCEFRMRT
jgi:hypothetical protein